jgi:aminoglycoside 3-N-acetyltransferase I
MRPAHCAALLVFLGLCAFPHWTTAMAEQSSFTVRALGPEDLDTFRALNAVFGEAFEDKDTYASAPPSAAYLESLLGSPGFIALAALKEEKVIGGLAAYVLRKFERERSEIYIFDLAVIEAHRRRGAAAALINELRKMAAALGAWVVYVQADPSDAPAVALYTKLGRREDVYHFDIEPE